MRTTAIAVNGALLVYHIWRKINNHCHAVHYLFVMDKLLASKCEKSLRWCSTHLSSMLTVYSCCSIHLVEVYWSHHLTLTVSQCLLRLSYIHVYPAYLFHVLVAPWCWCILYVYHRTYEMWKSFMVNSVRYGYSLPPTHTVWCVHWP